MTTTLARLTFRNKKQNEGTFAEMNFLKKRYIQEGYSKSQLHVGYACHKGIVYCHNCGEQVVNPYNDWYQGKEFWRCKCKQINFIENKYENSIPNSF